MNTNMENFLSIPLIAFSLLINGALSVLIPNSCVGLPDGTHWLKLINDDSYPLVKVDCSNEFMILDVDKEPKLKDYFSSWAMWHYGIAGPINDDPVNWDDWYLPSKYDTMDNELEASNNNKNTNNKENTGKQQNINKKTSISGSEFAFEGEDDDDDDSDVDTTTQYVISKDCNVCEKSNENGFSAKASYMTGNLYGCFWYIRGLHDCDMDWESYECFYCLCNSDTCTAVSESEVTDEQKQHTSTGTCATIQKTVTFEVAADHDSCTSDSGKTFKPSLGTDGRNCVCVQPSTPQYFEIDTSKLPKNFYDNWLDQVGMTHNTMGKHNHRESTHIRPHNEKDIMSKQEEEEEEKSESIDDVYYLTQNDFLHGTFRITKPGTYMIMEDIIFDFNSGIANENGAWMPHSDQIDDYPGAAQYRDAYFMGFFAGITVEIADVIIDLNSHTLKQSDAFYYQQRWFSHIELANQPFMPAQGPGMFGDTVVAADNVEIKNGVFGLTSHHAIHGNRCNNVNIHDIEIKDFETHGIQINGFKNLILNNIEIHGTSDKAYLRGEYGHARMLLPRLKKIYEEDIANSGYDDNEATMIKFPNRGYGKVVSMKQIYEEMEKEINMAFNYVVNGVSYDDTNDLEKYRTWQATKKNFLYMSDELDDIGYDAVNTNSNGLPYGTAVYGIFLSFPGANVFSYGSSNLKSYNAQISNIKIHGIRHKMHEYLRFHQSIPFNVNPFNAVFDVNNAVSDPTDIENSHYEGNIMTDAYIAMNKLTKNWGYLQMQNLDEGKLVKWAANDVKLSLDDYSVKCNSDVMTHSGKGIVGIRVDGIDNVEFDNIEIYNMYDYTKLGSQLCGDYEYGHGTGGGHFLQQTPMQTGFSGNMMQGISIVNSNAKLSNINVHDIGSATGLAYGIALWKDSNIEMNGNIINSNIKAGFQIDMNSLEFEQRPNKAPEACGIMTYWDYGEDTTTVVRSENDIETENDENDNDLNVVSECITGHVGCFNSEIYGATTLGKYTSCQDSNSDRGINSEYLSELDMRLLSVKDKSHDLIDFDSRKEALVFEQSQDIFKSHNLDASLNNDIDSSKTGVKNEESRIKVKDGTNSNDRNGRESKIGNLPQFFTGLAITVFTILGLIFAAMSYGMYKSLVAKAEKEKEYERSINQKTGQYTSLNNIVEFDPNTLGYGAC